MAAKGQILMVQEKCPNMEPMSMDEFGFWMTAILEDDIDIVTRELSLSDISRKSQLINGNFQTCSDLQQLGVKQKEVGHYSNCRLATPLCLAAVYGSVKTLEIFINHGVDVLQKDIHEVNILHAIAKMAFIVPSKENSLAETYKFLKCKLDLGNLRQLLMGENSDGLRPLELASNLGCFSLMQVILETEGVYLSREEPQSCFNVKWFDVTDYESTKPGNRRRFSPLVFSLFVDQRAVTNPACHKFFRSDLFKSWTQSKFEANRSNLAIWFCLRILYLIVMGIFEGVGGWNDISKMRTYFALIQNGSLQNSSFAMDYACFVENVTSTTSAIYVVLGSSLILMSGFVIVFDMIEICQILRLKQSWRWMLPTGRKHFLVNILFYRAAHFTMALCLLLSVITRLYENLFGSGPPMIVIDIMYIVSIISAIASFIYFLQIIPWIGPFIIAVQRMISDIFKFLVVFTIFLIPFLICFRRLIVQNIIGPCPPEFESGTVTIYTVFTILLNMMSFSKLELETTGGVFFFHIIFVFVSGILLLNFLIANFTNSLGFISDNEDIILTVQKLSVVWPCEDRLTTMLPNLVHRQHARSFVYDKDKDKFYVSRVQIRE